MRCFSQYLCMPQRKICFVLLYHNLLYNILWLFVTFVFYDRRLQSKGRVILLTTIVSWITHYRNRHERILVSIPPVRQDDLELLTKQTTQAEDVLQSNVKSCVILIPVTFLDSIFFLKEVIPVFNITKYSFS